MKTVDEFVLKIREVTDFASAGEIQRFLAQALQDPDLGPFFARIRNRPIRKLGAKAPKIPGSEQTPVTVADFVRESLAMIDAPSLSPSAVAAAIQGNASEIESFRDKLLWIARGRVADGPCIDLKPRNLGEKQVFPYERDKTVYLTRGFHSHICNRLCPPGCKKVGSVHYGSTWRGIPHAGSEMMVGSQLIRPDDPRVGYLQHRAREVAAQDASKIRADLEPVAGKNGITVKTRSGEYTGRVVSRPGGIEVISGQDVKKIAFCDLISWEKSHRAKRAERKKSKKQAVSRGRWGRNGTTYHG